MKPLLPIILLTSLTTFGQVGSNKIDTAKLPISLNVYGQAETKNTLTITPGQNGEPDLLTLDIKMRPHYDTLRAVLLITLASSRMGIAHARGGYVVMNGSEVVNYLDCRKREIKQPAVVWGWIRKNKK